MKRLFYLFLVLTFYFFLPSTVQSQSSCTAPSNLAVGNISAYGVDISFDMAESNEQTLSHSQDFTNQLQLSGSSMNVQVAHRFTTSDLTSFNGFSLNRVAFVPTNVNCNYSIMVWQGGNNYGSGTLMLEQPLLSSDLQLFTWNEIPLTISIPIVSNQELWIGIKCFLPQTGSLMGCDAGPEVPGKGNLIYANNSWYELTDLNSSITINFCIRGIISKESYNFEYGAHGFILGSGTKVQVPFQKIDSIKSEMNYVGLHANTTYDGYIQKDCGGGNLSDWAGPITFTTPFDTDWCSEDFENYTVGNNVAAEAIANGNNCWTTWNRNPGSAEDGTVTDEFALQGIKAAKLTYGNDLMFLLGDKTMGNFVVEYSMYIPTGKDAYTNLLHDFAGGNSIWGTQIYFNQNNRSPGTGSLLVGGQTSNFSFPHNQWFPVKFIIDLFEDNVQLIINHVTVKTWQYSLQSTSNSVGQKKLAAIGFYPPTSANISLFYIDNVNIAYLGSIDNPLTIDNVQDLEDLRTAVAQNSTYKNVPATISNDAGFANSYFVVTNDLDLSSVCGENINGQEVNWIPIGTATRPFKGKINGNHHIIKNLYYNSSQNDVGLFGVVDGAVIDSLHFEGGKITAGNNVGALCGSAKNNASFSAITNGMKITGNENVGGIVGVISQSTTLSQCSNTGTIRAHSQTVGGIVGKIENSFLFYAMNGGLIYGFNTAGGIVGSVSGNNSTVQNAISTGMIVCENNESGGIAGKIVNSPTLINLIYDKQIYTKASNGVGKLTQEIIDNNLQGELGDDNFWTFSPNLYPRITTTASSNVSLLLASPFLMDSTENIELIVNEVHVSIANNVRWSSLDSLSLTIANDVITFNCLDTVTPFLLSACIEDNVKEYELINYKQYYYSADTLWLCRNQLPFLYQDSILITAPIDTFVVYTTAYGCDSIIGFTVILHEDPQIVILADTTPCYGDDVTIEALSDSTINHYLWSTGDTTPTFTLFNVTSNLEVTLQTVIEYDRTSCSSTDTLKIRYNPVYNHDDSVGICYSFLPYEYSAGIFLTDSGWQSPIVFQTEKGCDSIINVYLHLYYDSSVYDTVVVCKDQLPYVYGDTTFLEGTTSGEYTFISTNITGCKDLVYLNLLIIDNPQVSIIGDFTPCYGDNTLLLARSDNPTDHFVWDNGNNTPLRMVDSVITNIAIFVQAIRDFNNTSCYGYDTVLISYKPIYHHTDSLCICYSNLPQEYGNSGVIMSNAGWQPPIVLQAISGCDSIIHVFLNVAYDIYDNDTLEICQNDLPFYYGDSIFPITTTTGNYTVAFLASTGCDSIIYLNLTVNPIPSVTHFTGDNRIFLHDTVALSVTTPDYFHWSTGDTTNNIIVVPPTVGDIDYKVYLSNDFGCVDTFVYTIRVEGCGNNYPAYDFEQQDYQTKFYGRVCWMIENLRSTRFADGEPIPGALSYYSSVYPDSLYNVSTFGRLYNWYTATRYGNEIHYDSPDLQNQGVCPEGWRLPTHAEYMVFMSQYGYTLSDLKSINYWLDGSGNNNSGFTWTPAGYFNFTANQYRNLYGNGYFITLTSVSNSHFESFACGYNCPDMQREVANKMNGYSVRCIKTVDN